MKTGIFTFSQTGNTLKVAHAIADGLENHGFKPEIIRYLNRNQWCPDNYELIGIGCPVHDNRPAKCMIEFLNKCSYNFKRKKVFVFITSESSPAKSLWHLARTMEKKGAEVIGGIQVRGMSTYPTMFGIFPNRPDDNDLSIAEKFGHEIACRMRSNSPLSNDFKINKNNGGIFYDHLGPFLKFIKRIITPDPEIDKEKCTLCGRCVYECPVDNLTIDKGAIKVNYKCEICYRCWHVCPQEAITLKQSPGNGVVEHLLYSKKMARYFGNMNPDEVYGVNLYREVIARKIRLKYNKKNPTAEYEFKYKM